MGSVVLEAINFEVKEAMGEMKSLEFEIKEK